MARVVMDNAGLAELLSPTGPVAQDLLRRGLKVEARAVDLCPVDTGRLRGSITHEDVEQDADGLVIRIGTNVEYAEDVEVGTGLFGPHHQVIVPTTAQALAWHAPDGTLIIRKSVKGSPAQPFLRPALIAGAD